MRTLVMLILLGLALLSIADQHGIDADSWYQNQYAALWWETQLPAAGTLARNRTADGN